MHAFVYAGIINYKKYYNQELTCDITFVLFSNSINSEYSQFYEIKHNLDYFTQYYCTCICQFNNIMLHVLRVKDYFPMHI